MPTGGPGRRSLSALGALKTRFLAAFRERGVVTHACIASGTPEANVYRWRKHDPEFAAAFREAEHASTERMEAECYRRAVDGWEHPVYHQGKVVGTEQRYSDLLMIFMLKARKPEMYRDTVKVDSSNTEDSLDLSRLTTDELRQLERLQRKAKIGAVA